MRYRDINRRRSETKNDKCDEVLWGISRVGAKRKIRFWLSLEAAGSKKETMNSFYFVEKKFPCDRKKGKSCGEGLFFCFVRCVFLMSQAFRGLTRLPATHVERTYAQIVVHRENLRTMCKLVKWMKQLLVTLVDHFLKVLEYNFPKIF